MHKTETCADQKNQFRRIAMAYILLISISSYGETKLKNDSTETIRAKTKDTICVFKHCFPIKRDSVISRRPSIELIGGLAESSINGLDSTFYSHRTFEFRLGHMEEIGLKESEKITKLKGGALFYSNSSSDGMDNPKTTGIKTEVLKIGASSQEGYEYRFTPSFGLREYNSNGLFAGRTKLLDSIPNATKSAALAQYQEVFRFGSKTQGALQFRLGKHVALGAGFDRSILFPGWFFWKWAGSSILEGAAQGLLSHFIQGIMASSPNAVPAVDFFLRNGLAIGIYELRKEKENWPFESDAPLFEETGLVGITVLF